MRMAKEAGWEMDDSYVLEPQVVWYISQGQLERFAALVAAAERKDCLEACRMYVDLNAPPEGFQNGVECCIAVITHKSDPDVMARIKAKGQHVHAVDTSEERVHKTEKNEHEWVGLTDEEIADMHHEIKVKGMGAYKTEDIYRAIEAKLKEKNR